ncbi:MAG: cupin domain-containing protein [Gammaproteobacteria bacterium]|nr:cupin domain-containing protein [Gammaproteobacteria bacterium]MCP5406773.1 cupin domain-containing protein [Chromatiaceae bacterium]MCP5444503.1 cupin domain-containing protein [Chromatiaceae bacterium]
MDVGTRLKAARKNRGFSQRKLAQMADVSNGTISLIEQNKISPSVSLLKRLLEAVSMSLGEFFDDARFSREKQFYRADEFTEHTFGNMKFFQIGGNLQGRRLQIMRECYPPGGDTGDLMLVHQGEEGGIVIRGEIEVTVGDDVALLSAGDAYYFESNIPHRFRNPGDKECEVVSVCTPPNF